MTQLLTIGFIGLFSIVVVVCGVFILDAIIDYFNQQQRRPRGNFTPSWEAAYFRDNGSLLDADEMTPEEQEDWEIFQREQAEAEARRDFLMREAARREVEFKRQRQAEQAEIQKTFQAWLITFGEGFGLVSYRDLAALTQYIGAIISYGLQHFDGTLPIKRTYEVIANGEGFSYPPPNPQCAGRVFFGQLSKALASIGILSDGAGPQGRSIDPSALTKLRPASNGQRPSVHPGPSVGERSPKTGETEQPISAQTRTESGRI